jgi:hypothetical protein
MRDDDEDDDVEEVPAGVLMPPPPVPKKKKQTKGKEPDTPFLIENFPSVCSTLCLTFMTN